MRAHSLLALLLCSCFAGCYESAVPLAPPSAALPIDPALLGDWDQLHEAGKTPARLRLFKWDDTHYYGQLDSPGEEPIRCSAYLVKLDGIVFLNVQNIADEEPEKRTFIFFRYRILKDGGLGLDLVSDTLFPEKLRTTKELAERVRRNLTNEKLFKPALSFKRA